MALGAYGTVRPADVSPQDVDIILNYTPSRDVTNNFVLKKLNSANILTPYFHNSQTGGVNGKEILGGLYNLRLPANEFNQIGIYTLYIRPAEIRTTITDCGVLSALPNVKGIIVDLNDVPAEFRNKFTAQGLVGFRVEYLNSDGTKIPNFYRIITSSFFCKPNATPFIGQPNQEIIISNTYFNPFTVDIQIAEHDIDTLAIALYGNQTKSIEDGIYTLYDTAGNIYKQYNLFEVRDTFNELLYEVRQDRGLNIDFSKNFTNIIS